MSWPRLCALLGELGFEGAERLDPDSFEWPFQYDDARTILFWICSSHHPSNVLSFFELFHYEQFVEEGKLLEGEDLDFAYDSISAFSSRRDNQEAVFGAEEGLKDIRDATVAYKAEALELQKQLRHLQSQLDMLTGQASALIQGRRARVAAMSTMNEVLGRIASTAQELAHYHSGDDIVAQDNACLTVGERKSRGKVFSVACDLLMNFYSLSIRAEEGIYLAYSDFHSYLVGDSSCIKELNQWFAKQLDMIVKHHSQDVGLRRRVLVDFFCNPEPLGSQVWELTARV